MPANSLPDRDTLRDRILGVIYGQAVGDALGLGTEGLTADTASAFYPRGLRDYSDIVRDYHRRRWQPGEWTDDTEQMLHVLESITECRRVDPVDIAKRFYHWLIDDGRGVGMTVHSVIRSPQFLTDPLAASYDYWRATGRMAAANGGVMRTSVLGIWQFESESAVQLNASDVCRITHYDPRCVGSCVIVSVLISRLLRGITDQEELTKGIGTIAIEHDPRIPTFLWNCWSPDIESLQLDSDASMGYTLKTLSAGFWAALHGTDYEETILKVIMAGGDADTNAAVAGAILGARYGVEAIPKKWIKGLYTSQYLERVANEFADVQLKRLDNA